MITKEKKLKDWLSRIIFKSPYLAIALFPIIGSVILISRRIISNIYNYAPFIALGIFFFLLISFFIFKINRTFVAKGRLTGVIFIFFLAFLFRYFLIDIFQTPPASDSLLAFDMAKKWVDGPNYSFQHFFAQHWGIYTLVLAKTFSFFGEYILTAKIINTLAASIASVIVYLFLHRITGRNIWSLLGGVLMALWPSYALYANILTGEHIFILFFILALLILTYADGALNLKNGSIKEYYMYIFLFSLSIGLANIFKETTVITVPATLGALSLLIFKSKWEGGITKASILTLTMLILFITTASVTQISDTLVSKYAMGPIDKYKTGYFIATGLNIENRGRYNEKIVNLYREPILEAINLGVLDENVYKESDRKAKSYALKTAIREFKNLPKLFIHKFNTVWSNEDEINNRNVDNYQILNMSPDHSTLDSLLKKTKNINYASNLYFLTIMIFSGFGALYLLKGKAFQPSTYLAALTIFGYSLALMIIEVQTHYRSILYPLFTIFAALGSMATYEYIHKKRRRG
jgi:hypothetical protein